MAITLTNICAPKYCFIDEEFAKIVCKILEIKPQRLIKPKQI